MTRIKRCAGALLAAAALSATAVWVTQAQTSNSEVQRWLDRMNAAVEELNYRGSYIHISDGEPELFTISHRFAGGVVRERITTSGDAAREILRGQDRVLTVIPERRRVIVEELDESSSPRAGSLLYTDALRNLYASRTLERGRVADRPTQYVSIEPRDGYRYGYRLWLDLDTALLLKSQLIGEEGQVVEQMMYTDIDKAPWFVVDADDKKAARLNCIHHLLQQIEYDDYTPDPAQIPARISVAFTAPRRAWRRGSSQPRQPGSSPKPCTIPPTTTSSIRPANVR